MTHSKTSSLPERALLAAIVNNAEALKRVPAAYWLQEYVNFIILCE